MVPKTIINILKIVGVVLVGYASNIWAVEFAFTAVEHPDRPPFIAGVIVLGVLTVLFAIAYWWLFHSPLPEALKPLTLEQQAKISQQEYQFGVLMIVAFVLWIIGGVWDSLWHAWLGLVVNDVLWPPHIFIYGSILVIAVISARVIGSLIGAKNGLRAAARQSAAVSRIALVAVYMLASIPSDLVWHRIYGADITILSIPHLYLLITFSLIVFTTMILWLRRVRRSRFWLPVMLFMVACMVYIQFLTALPGQEWFIVTSENPISLRPGWVWPLLAMIIGLLGVLTALYTTRKPGSATVLALIVLVSDIVVHVISLTLPINPPLGMSASILMIPGAIVADLCFVRVRSLKPERQAMYIGLAYILVHWLAFMFQDRINSYLPALSISNALIGAALSVGFLVAFAQYLPGMIERLSSQENVNYVTTEAAPALQKFGESTHTA